MRLNTFFKGRTDLVRCMMFVENYSREETASNTKDNVFVGGDFYAEWRKKLEGTLAWWNARDRDLLKGEVCVDETVIGKRKYNKGRRQRKNGQMWFQGMAEVCQDKRTVKKVVLRYLENRRAENMSRPLSRYIAPRTVIVTDEHASYKCLKKTDCTHETVNHSKGEWVNSRGFTTNPIEGVFGVLKRASRRNFSLNRLQKARRVNWALQAQVFRMNKRLESQNARPSDRFGDILAVIRDFHVKGGYGIE